VAPLLHRGDWGTSHDFVGHKKPVVCAVRSSRRFAFLALSHQSVNGRPIGTEIQSGAFLGI